MYPVLVPVTRLISSLPNLLAVVRPIAQIAAIALGLGGCSAIDGLSSSYATYPTSAPLFLTDSMPVTARKELLDRYTCATGGPLMCVCASRLSATCDCHC